MNIAELKLRIDAIETFLERGELHASATDARVFAIWERVDRIENNISVDLHGLRSRIYNLELKQE